MDKCMEKDSSLLLQNWTYERTVHNVCIFVNWYECNTITEHIYNMCPVVQSLLNFHISGLCPLEMVETFPFTKSNTSIV
jgi:hypothetical protein